MPKSVYSRPYRVMVAALVAARKARGVSQVELAAATGRSQACISKVELCERRLDLVEFIELAHALAQPPGALLERVYALYLAELKARRPKGRPRRRVAGPSCG